MSRYASVCPKKKMPRPAGTRASILPCDFHNAPMLAALRPTTTATESPRYVSNPGVGAYASESEWINPSYPATVRTGHFEIMPCPEIADGDLIAFMLEDDRVFASHTV